MPGQMPGSYSTSEAWLVHTQGWQAIGFDLKNYSNGIFYIDLVVLFMTTQAVLNVGVFMACRFVGFLWCVHTVLCVHNIGWVFAA